jgi:PleD family two-component response regulator
LFNGLLTAIKGRPFVMEDGAELRITVSVGVCTEMGENLDFMLRAADRLLYHAKEQGRDQVVIDFDTD